MPNGMSDQRVEEIVMRLLSKELEPFRDWMLGFWSNGSKDRPLGFFQMRVKAEDDRFTTRVKQDDERYERLQEETKGQSETLEVVKQFMASQVAAREAREKAEREVAEQKEKEEKEKKERRARNWAIARWIGGIVGPALLALMAWAYHAMAPVVQILWQDYLKAHPIVMQQLQNRSSIDPSLDYAGSNKTQDAVIPKLAR